MMPPSLQTGDLAALAFFVTMWFGFELVLERSPWRFKNLSSRMAVKRREWMLTMAERDLRMIDTAIITGLQQGAAFFGSASILAIGGTFALLGSTDLVQQIVMDLALSPDVSSELARGLWEMKVLGLSVICVYSFFKFAWAYRLFNYCSILIGAVPNVSEAPQEKRRKAAIQAAEMNIIASRHFTSGLRGIFFALAYLGWFLGPWALGLSTLFVVAVLTRRQYFSRAKAVLDDA